MSKGVRNRPIWSKFTIPKLYVKPSLVIIKKSNFHWLNLYEKNYIWKDIEIGVTSHQKFHKKYRENFDLSIEHKCTWTNVEQTCLSQSRKWFWFDCYNNMWAYVKSSSPSYAQSHKLNISLSVGRYKIWTFSYGKTEWKITKTLNP